MRQRIFLGVFLCLFLVQSIPLGAQFTPEERAERERIEKFLSTAEIIKSEEIGEGVTKPLRLTLRQGDTECRGCWKNPRGIKEGFLEGWQYEIAAYRMDKLLGLDMIPPTVEREFDGKKGSLQFWVDSEMSDLERMDQGISIPAQNLEEWNKRKYLMRAYDCLIANDDRTQQNIRYTADWRMILIDHSRSFRSSKEYCQRLVYGKNGIKGAKLFRQLPRDFIERVKALDFEMIKGALGPYLEDKEIKAILLRKDLLLKEIAEMIEEKGEDQVLYSLS